MPNKKKPQRKQTRISLQSHHNITQYPVDFIIFYSSFRVISINHNTSHNTNHNTKKRNAYYNKTVLDTNYSWHCKQRIVCAGALKIRYYYFFYTPNRFISVYTIYLCHVVVVVIVAYLLLCSDLSFHLNRWRKRARPRRLNCIYFFLRIKSETAFYSDASGAPFNIYILYVYIYYMSSYTYVYNIYV